MQVETTFISVQQLEGKCKHVVCDRMCADSVQICRLCVHTKMCVHACMCVRERQTDRHTWDRQTQHMLQFKIRKYSSHYNICEVSSDHDNRSKVNLTKYTCVKLQRSYHLAKFHRSGLSSNNKKWKSSQAVKVSYLNNKKWKSSQAVKVSYLPSI